MITTNTILRTTINGRCVDSNQCYVIVYSMNIPRFDNPERDCRMTYKGIDYVGTKFESKFNIIDMYNVHYDVARQQLWC